MAKWMLHLTITGPRIFALLISFAGRNLAGWMWWFLKNFRESYVFHCLVIKVLYLPPCDSSFILSHSQLFVKNFFNFFQNFLSKKFWNGEGGIWTLAPLLTTYSLSRGAPSASLGTSPNCPTQSLWFISLPEAFYIISRCFSFVKNFFDFFQNLFYS